MSLNYLTTYNGFDMFVGNVTTQGELAYDIGEIQPDRVLKLQRVDQYHDLVYWSDLNLGVDSIYANQTDVIIRSAEYSEVTTNMYFDGFKYNKPSYVSMSADKRSITISSPGYYMAILTVCTAQPEQSTQFSLTIDNFGIAGSFCATSPSRVAFQTAEQYTTASSTCLFNVGPIGTIRLQIEPPVITSVISESSNLTIIKLLTVPA